MAVNESKARPDSPQWAKWRQSPPGAIGTIESAIERAQVQGGEEIGPGVIFEHGQNLMLHEARRFLGDIPNIANALAVIKEDPGIYLARMREFQSVLDFMVTDVAFYNEDKELGISSGIEADKYTNALSLVSSQSAVDHILVSNPREFLWWSTDTDGVVSAARSTFLDIRGKLESGEWEFPTDVIDPRVLTSALLVEGYGLFLERITGEEGTARRFVLGFEEVLWNRMKGSEMLNDVLPWMIEERGDFCPTMSSELEQAVQILDAQH